MIERPERKVLTVSALTQSIKLLVEGHFPFVWVEGEISDLRAAPSGTTYFTLRDENAQVKAVLFKINSRYLRFRPEDGMYVVCQGRVSIYEARGQYQLIIDHMEPKGIGALQQAFVQLRDQLEKEGLFAAEHKKKLLVLPRTIGVVSSITGAALYDFLRVVITRFANLRVLIYPTRVQGEGAAKEMAEAIFQLNQIKDVDVIVLCRGGGSLEDLWAFNEAVLARAIFASKIPVVSAVGHEVDFTIADFVADVRAATPTAAGELVVPKKDDLKYQIDVLEKRLAKGVGREYGVFRERLAHLVTRLARVKGRIEDIRLKVDAFQLQIKEKFLSRTRDLVCRLNECRLGLRGHDPRQHIKMGRFRILSLTRELQVTIERRLARKASQIREVGGRLEASNPVAILGRGYSITKLLPAGTVLREGKDVAIGSRIRVQLYKGELFCRVERVKP